MKISFGSLYNKIIQYSKSLESSNSGTLTKRLATEIRISQVILNLNEPNEKGRPYSVLIFNKLQLYLTRLGEGGHAKNLLAVFIISKTSRSDTGGKPDT